MIRNLRLSSYLIFWYALLFIIISVTLIFMVNWQMKKQALTEAERQAGMMLDKNLATHTYFSHELKPNIFKWTEPFRHPDYFDPSWMSSTYAVRQMDKIFHQLTKEPYYYKESAINARSPEAEADDYEKGFLQELEKDPKLTKKTEIRYFDGRPYLTVLRRGETFELSCMRCHTNADIAPKGMVDIYGPDRSFGRSIDQVVQAISIRIPLEAAYLGADKFSLELSVALLTVLLGGFVGLFVFTKYKIISPLEQIRNKAELIANSSDHLGETIPEPQDKDFSDLAKAFNTMSTNLRKSIDELEARVVERTEAFHESELKYKTVADHTYDWEYWVAPDGSLKYVSPSCERITGYQANEFIASPKMISQIVKPEDLSIVDTDFDIIDSGGPRSNEFRIVTRSGEELWIEHRCQAVFADDGRWLGRRASNRDITNRKLAEEALKESEERFRLAVTTCPDAIYITRAEDGFFIEVNDAFTEMSGYTKNDVVSETPSHQNIWGNPEEREKIVRLLMEKGSCTNQEVVFQRKDGSVFPGLMSASLISHKGASHIISFTRDITDRIQAEKEKLALQTQLFQSQKLEALGTLVGGIAHDFNNMLQGIIGYSEILLMDKAKGEPGYKELQTIIETSLGGADLVKKLLAFGQQGQVFRAPLDLNNQVSQLLPLIYRTLPQLVHIDLDLIDGPTTISADQGQMDQVVMNLAINSSEAMPDGGLIKISTKIVSLDTEYCNRHRGVKPGNYVMLSVLDTGRGMDMATLTKIFDPFFSTKQRGSSRGTGLGLSVVQGIVQQSGGHLNCESQPGKGTEFKIYFPAIENPIVKVKAGEANSNAMGLQTILIVEDAVPVAELERTMLEKAGYRVIWAKNGKEALNIYQSRKEEISLVVLDLLMPEMSGRDCLMQLVKMDPAVNVILASGYSPGEDLREEISPLVKGFLHKPFEMADLLKGVRSVLNGV